MKQTSEVYSVMDGEPHLGRVRETAYVFDRDDILEGLIEVFCDDMYAVSFKLGEEYVDVSDFISSEDYEVIEEMLTEVLLGDDFGSDKYFALITDLIEGMVGKNATYECERQEYV